MRSKSLTPLFNAGICLFLSCSPVFAHHSAFCGAILQAVEKPDVVAIEDLFEESAFKGTEGAMSGPQLQERLNRGNLVPLHESSDLEFDVYASNDEFDSRLRCVITFKLNYGGDTASEEQVFLLAKRIRDDGFSNPEAWKIWRIVTDRTQAECFLGSKI